MQLPGQLGDRDHEHQVEEQLQPGGVPLSLLAHRQQPRRDDPRLAAGRDRAVSSRPPTGPEAHPVERTLAPRRTRRAGIRRPRDSLVTAATAAQLSPSYWLQAHGLLTGQRACEGRAQMRRWPHWDYMPQTRELSDGKRALFERSLQMELA